MATQFRSNSGALEMLLSLIGRAPDREQPPVEGMLSPEELDQMRVASSGNRDMGRVKRIEEVQRLRQQHGMPDAAMRAGVMLGDGSTAGGGLLGPLNEALRQPGNSQSPSWQNNYGRR
jgi:hypothetical protein